MQPIRQKMSAHDCEKAGERSGLIAEQKRFAFRHERVFLMAICVQKFEAYKRVQDRAQPADWSTSFLANLRDSLRSACERIENVVAHGCPVNERWRVSETKLHQTFGSDLILFGTFHRRSTIVQRLFVGKSKSTFAKSGRIFTSCQLP